MTDTDKPLHKDPGEPEQRALILVHYNALGGVAEHVLYTLRECRPLFAYVAVVSNSPLTDEDTCALQPYVDELLVRENAGFDFMAWKEGIDTMGWDAIQTYDSLTLMNDTCFGPLGDLAGAYARMEENGPDFWGLTAHPRSIERSTHFYRFVREHIQSYFMVFHQPVLRSPVFRRFWDAVISLDDVWDVIVRYEMRLTQKLASAGFRFRPFVERAHGKHPRQHRNLAHYEPAYLIDEGVPFVKVKSFALSTQRHAALELIASRSLYPVELIGPYIKKTLRPDLAARLACREVSVDGPCPEPSDTTRAALFLNARGPESFARYRPGLERIMGAAEPRPDVYLMVASQDATSTAYRMDGDITAVLTHAAHQHPWLVHAERINSYDVVGFLDIRDDDPGARWMSAMQDEYIRQLLVASAARLIGAFAADPTLGIVCPDRPPHDVRALDDIAHKQALACLRANAPRLRGKRTFDAKDAYAIFAPYGSCFWCRPAALRPLLALAADRSGPHKLPDAAFMDLALSYLPVYAAWVEGYDYAVATNAHLRSSGQQVHLLREESQKLTHQNMISRPTWRLGNVFLCLPYLASRAIQRLRGLAE